MSIDECELLVKIIYYDFIILGQKPFINLKRRMHKINWLNDILRYGDETLKIVEAIAEHDFALARLIVMLRATE